jgi:site-specific recombinase XerD
MPVYIESITQIIFEDDVRKMWANAKYEYERLLLSLMWITGARPAELLELKKHNIFWGIGDDGLDFLEIRLVTKKLGTVTGFVVKERTLRTSRPLGMKSNIYVEKIIQWCLKLQPDDFVLKHRSRMSLNRIMHKLSATVGHCFSVYHFRHSVFTHMAANGATLSTLMYWKGAADIGSVSAYIHATPVYLQIENQRRERDLSAGPRKNIPVRYSAQVIERKATAEEIKDLPEAKEE